MTDEERKQYNEIAAPFVAAIKELKEQIRTLQSDLNAARGLLVYSQDTRRLLADNAELHYQIRRLRARFSDAANQATNVAKMLLDPNTDDLSKVQLPAILLTPSGKYDLK
jgi:uncharacterized coiled-coil DUF342 family protein